MPCMSPSSDPYAPFKKPDPLFQGMFRNASARCPSWDYSSAGAYFVTINTQGRFPWFGKIREGIMDLSVMGHIAQECWQAIPAHQPHVSLDAYVIMPDHMHGIVIIGTVTHRHGPSRFGPLRHGSLASIVHGYKSACTKRIRDMGHPAFAWQPRYHDRIVRDDDALRRIRRYIIDNPRRWSS